MLTMRHFKIFQCVAHCLNMSHAAKQLYISQPTVSQTISEIEKFYEVKLFERFPKKLYLTSEGERLLSAVNNLSYSYDQVNTMNLKDTSTILYIGATHTIEDSILDNLLSSAQKASSTLDFYVKVTNTANIEEQILSNELDFGIVEGQIDNHDIITEPITEDTLLLICSPEHRLMKNENITINDLNHESFILREKGSGTRELFEKKMAINHLNFEVKWECAAFNAIKNAVINNRGIGVISSRMISKELDNGSLVVLPLDEFIWQRNFYICYHKNKDINKNILPFYETVTNFSD